MKVENRIMKNKTRNIIWTVAGVLFLIGLVYASTITDTYTTNGNITNNNTGIYYNNQKTFARTADVVVCRGTSLLDDLYKRFSCDVVCLSTDNDCGDDINNSQSLIPNGGKILLRNGNYSINISRTATRIPAIDLRKNVVIEGESKYSTILNVFGNVNNQEFSIVLGTSTGQGSIGIKNLQINMNASNLGYTTYTTHSWLVGIQPLNSANDSTIQDVIINNFDSTRYVATNMSGIGINTFNSPRLKINNVNFDTGDYGIWVTREFDNTETGYLIDNVYFRNMVNGSGSIYIEAVDGAKLSNIYVTNGSGIQFNNGLISNVVLDNLIMKNITGYAIAFYGTAFVTRDVEISNFILDRNVASGTNKDMIVLSGSINYNINIHDGLISNCATDGHGINLNAGVNAKVSNVEVSSCYFGIKVAQAFGRADLVNVKSHDNANAGYQLQGGRCINCIANNNHKTGAYDGGFRLDGTPTYPVELVNPFCYDDAGSKTQNMCVDLYQSNGTIIINMNNNVTNAISTNTRTSFFMDSYEYGIINQTYTPCIALSTNIFNERTIYNTTNGCRCTSGSWKCWSMS